MFRLFRVLLCFCALFVVDAAYAAGYVCSTKRYTACADGFYPSECGTKRDGSAVTTVAGGSCLACPSGYNCTGSNLNCPAEAGTSCAPGTFWDGGNCAPCTAKYYCPGFTNVMNPSTNYGRYACPDANTNKRPDNAIPAEYYGAKITETDLTGNTGLKAITECKALSWYGDNSTPAARTKTDSGENPVNGCHVYLYEYVNYNTSTTKYDKNPSFRYMAVGPGCYLTDPDGCGMYAYYKTVKVCESGTYCPGKARSYCSSSTQSSVHTTTYGKEACPAGATQVATWNGDTASVIATSIGQCGDWQQNIRTGYGASSGIPANGDGTMRCYYDDSESKKTYSTGCHYGTYTSCDPGYYMTYNGVYNPTPTVNNKCTPCAAGTYKSYNGTGQCGTCVNKPSNSIYSGTANTSTNCSWSCNAGYYGSSAHGDSSCAVCGTGNYCTGGINRTACTAVKANTSTTITTATSSNDCVCGAGSYLSGSTCVACPTDTYKASVSNSGNACMACPPGWKATGTTVSSHDSISDCTKTITLDKNGGSGCTYNGTCANSAGSQTCNYGTECNFYAVGSGKANNITWANDNYIAVGGWGTSPECNSTQYKFTNPSESKYYACKTYKVNFDLNGGTGTVPTGVYATYGSSMPEITTPNPTRAGYTFDGWYDSSTDWTGRYYKPTANGVAGTRDWDKTTAPTTLYAMWVQNTNTITLNKGGGTGTCGGVFGTIAGATTCKTGDVTSLPTWNSSTSNTCNITNGAKVFTGWSIRSNALSGGVYSITCPTANTQYNAVWSPVECAVTHGTCGTISVTNNTPSAQITCDTGYSQVGVWDRTDSFTVTGTAGNAKVTAECKPVQTAVSLNANGGVFGNGSVASNVTLTYDATMPNLTAAQIPTRAGYIFGGFYDEKQGGTLYYTSAGTPVRTWDKSSTTATLWAHWSGCENGQYAPAGSGACVNCPAAPDNSWTVSSDGARDSYTSCYIEKDFAGGAGSDDDWCDHLFLIYRAVSATKYSEYVDADMTYGVGAFDGGYVDKSNSKQWLCRKCPSGSVSPGGMVTQCTQCSDGEYAGRGATTCSVCPTPTHNLRTVHTTGKVAGEAWSDCYEEERLDVSNDGMGDVCKEGSRIYKATSATQYATTPVVGDTLKAHPGGYVNTTELICEECSPGSYSPGGTATSCSVCPNGSYSNFAATVCTACDKGYTNSGDRAAHAGVGSCKATCSGTEYVPTPGAGCVTVGTGYYGRSATSTAVAQNATLPRTQCDVGYRDGPAATTDEGCLMKVAAGNYVPARAEAGATCPNGFYCVGGSFPKSDSDQGKEACPVADSTTERTSFPDEYYPYDVLTDKPIKDTPVTVNYILNQSWGTGWAAQNQCRAFYSLKNAAANFTVENVRFNPTSGKYDLDGSSYYRSVNGGYYLTDKYNENYCDTATNYKTYKKAVTCPAGYYCSGGGSQLCSSGTFEDDWGKFICPAGSFCPAMSQAPTACAVGSYNNKTGSTTCVACGDGADWGMTTSASGATSCNKSCGVAGAKGYLDAKWNSNNTVTNLCVANSCVMDYYLDAVRDDDENIISSRCELCSSVANGLYPHSPNSGTAKGPEACFATREELNGYHIASPWDNIKTPCGPGFYSNYTYSEGGGSVVHYGEAYACNSCPENTYSSDEANTSCTACLDGYTTYGEKISEEACRIRCAGGTYLASARATECSPVGAGFWAAAEYVTQGNVGVRNACPVGMTTIGYGAGADEAGDCGHALHFGNGKLYLRSEKKTTPSLNIKINGKTFYGNMSTEDKRVSDGNDRKLKVKNGNKTYSVYDDSGEFYTGGGSGSVIKIDANLVATAIVPASVNDNVGATTWSATLSGGTAIAGAAQCSATTGTNGDISATGFTPEGSGAGCWCRITAPAAGSKWVFASSLGNTCSDKCAYICANNMNGNKAKNITYRTNLYNTAGIAQP